MKTKKNNWINNPSRKQLLLFTLVYFIAILLLVLSMTNLFTESIIQKKYIMIYFLIIGSTLAIIKVHHNYWKLKD